MFRTHDAEEVQLMPGHEVSLGNDTWQIDLSALPDEEKHLAELILQGYSTAEIAGLRGTTASAVRKRLQRIRLRHVSRRSND